MWHVSGYNPSAGGPTDARRHSPLHPLPVGIRRHRRGAATYRAAKAEARRAAGRGQHQAHNRGTWAIESTVKTAAGKDTVVNSLVTATADANGWVTHLAGREPIPTRVVAMGGDSVITEAGPFQSVARPGQTVTTHEALHFKDDAIWGTIEARYSNGDVVKGTVKGTRRK